MDIGTAHSGVHRVAQRYGGATAVVTGGAGFVGAHRCRALRSAGLRVIAVDSLITGARANVIDLLDDPSFELVVADVLDHLDVPDDLAAILHLASPASPVDYLRHPIHTLKVGSIGTLHTLGAARVARIFNTYGPGVRSDDGRLVPTLIGHALRGEPLVIHGGGASTWRSLAPNSGGPPPWTSIRASPARWPGRGSACGAETSVAAPAERRRPRLREVLGS